MPSFSVPLSGLNSSSQEMTLIANNLANLNTPGYKSSVAQFTTLFYQSLGESGDGNPMQVGTGTAIGNVTMNLTDGAIQSTGINSNLAIQGSGMFVVNNNGQQVYTRAGDFVLGNTGYLEASDGSLVQGYPAVNGVVNPNAPLGNLLVGSGITSPARATANVTMGMNLDSQTAVGGTFSQPVQVYDSLGGTHTLTATFTKTGTNAWSYTVTLPGADTGGATPTTMASGNLTFNTSGDLTGGTGTPPQITVNLTSPALADGAAAFNINWKLFGPQGNSLITQAAAASAPLASHQDGVPSGSLINFSIGPDGSITGAFSNGQSQTLGQVVLATFANDQGIQAVGNNNFIATAASGIATIGTPGSGNRGSVQGSSIEQSNVDIAGQFAELIQAQQSYEASAKAVTTFNQVTQATLNMQQ
ncbi:MAG: flagellar hook protein FlgE [Acidobacteria bacterium]|nr:MAG: flagellar hook protein FlgE [Acidobacteriota bacterium]